MVVLLIKGFLAVRIYQDTSMELSELPERLPKSTYRIGYFDERETKRQEYEDYTKDLVWGNTMARQPAPPYGDLVNKFLRCTFLPLSFSS